MVFIKKWKMYYIYIGVVCLLVSTQSFAYVACDNVDVKLQTASGSGFHNFSELGLTNGYLFIEVTPSSCIDSDDGTFGSRLFMVLDNMKSPDGLKNIWASMLLSAEARGKTISFHSYNIGTNSRGFQVLQPYYFRVN
jgi:hypothetical protein